MTSGVELSGLQVGLALGAASMISIGPNNLMLLREGLMRGRSGLTAGLVLASYGVLLMLALVMAAASFSVEQGWQTALCWGGLGALTWFAIQSFRAAFRNSSENIKTWQRETAIACAARVLKIVWCNPLTYVELLLIPAALAQSMSGNGDRIEFTGALLLASAVYCFGYAYGGEALARVIRSRKSIKFFDLVSGTILAIVAVGLAVKLASHIA